MFHPKVEQDVCILATTIYKVQLHCKRKMKVSTLVLAKEGIDESVVLANEHTRTVTYGSYTPVH